MKIQDKLLSDFLDGDYKFQNFVAERLTERNSRVSNFVIIDVNDTYRALITSRGMAMTAPLGDKTQLDTFNNTVKGLAMRFNQVPTHLHIQSDDLLRDYKSIVDHVQGTGVLGDSVVSEAALASAANDYLTIRSALGISGRMNPQDTRTTRLQKEAAQTRANISQLTQRQIESARQREQNRKIDYEDNRGAGNTTIIASLAAVTAGLLMHRAGVNVDSDTLQAAGSAFAVLGAIVGGSKAIQQLTQSAHLTLMDKSPWYKAKAEQWEAKAVKEFMSAHNVERASDLNRAQTESLIELITYSAPLMTDKDAEDRISSIMAITGGSETHSKSKVAQASHAAARP